jgi:hypothetical protein
MTNYGHISDSVKETILSMPKDNAVIFDCQTAGNRQSLAGIYNRIVNEHGPGKDIIMFLSDGIELLSQDCMAILISELMGESSIGMAGLKLLFPDGKKIFHGGTAISSQTPTGIHIRNLEDDTEFIHDEHSVLGVSMKCCLISSRTFSLLNGFNEDFFNEEIIGLDMGLRSFEHGLQNFYFGTLEAKFNTSIPFQSELNEHETDRLFSTHPSAILHLKNRFLKNNYYNDFKEAVWFDLPLRYRVADKANTFLQRMTFFHKVIKKILSYSQ